MKKILLRITITVILIFGVFVSVPLILSVLNKGEIAADIHKIEKASSPYLFKYHSSTFELFAGKKGDDPRITLVQGKRSLDISIKPAQQKPAPKPKQPQTQPSPTTQPDSNVDQEPPAEDINPVEETETQDTSFFPIGTVNASESVKVINPNTKPAIEYVNGSTSSDVLITPNQQKVAFTFDIESTPKTLPSLTINPQKIVPKQNGDEIVFTTRTNREAFALKNATLTDKKGAKTNVDLVLNSISKDNFNVTFRINSSWLSSGSRVYPLSLSVDTVSLFHERMVSASPTKPDFAATERPEFIIDISEVEEPLRSALIARDYSKLKFGAIDAGGKGRKISSELIATGDGNLKLRFTAGGSSIKPGLYDLLVQYEDDPSFIGEEEFSWGVLVMNPDQAVYKPKQEAKIDMAVLNEFGHVVCNADLVLQITDPKGNVATRTTSDGSIAVSSGCFQLETELPDYTTTYKTSAAGNYNMKLTATTVNGSYVVTDTFSVDPDSPFYVKRAGPTRIYPPKTYTMHLSIEANQDVSKIVETVPSNFEIQDSSEFTLSKDGKQTLTWKKQMKKGDKIDISYKFKGPRISPALFFIGPLTIGTWKEPRVWQIASDAIGFLETVTAVTNGGTSVNASFADITANNLIVAVCATRDSTTISISSPSGFSSAINTAGTPTQGIFYKVAGAGDTSITCSFSGSNTRMGLQIFEYSGTDTTQATILDGTAENNGNGTAIDCSSFTTTVDNDLVVGGAVVNANTNIQTTSWTDSFTGRNDFVNGGSPSTRSTYGGADKILTGTATVQPDAVADATGDWRCQIAAFEELVVSGPTNDQLLRHGAWFDGSATPEQPMTF